MRGFLAATVVFSMLLPAAIDYEHASQVSGVKVGLGSVGPSGVGLARTLTERGIESADQSGPERGSGSLFGGDGWRISSHGDSAPRSVSVRVSAVGGGASATAAIRSVFPAATENAAIRVARCESRLNRYAVGRAGERGLFQIHPVHFGWAQPGRLFDPVWNARVAFRLSRGGTRWGPWTCRWAA